MYTDFLKHPYFTIKKLNTNAETPKIPPTNQYTHEYEVEESIGLDLGGTACPTKQN